MERRLAAILIADVVGYSRLSEIDEERTRAQFRADMETIWAPAIEVNKGRLVKALGDGLLVEFHSVVDALRCAIDVQRQKREQARISADTGEQIQFRIGINLGDVLVEDDDIHGEGVNIADRIEALAEPGGIAISGSAYDQVRSRIQVAYKSLGGRRLKGFAEPVRVYRVLPEQAPARRSLAVVASWPKRARFLVVIVGVLLAAGGLSWWYAWPILSSPQAIGQYAHPLPDKPSVAVLPFTNVSGDATHDHLAEGLTDDLITELSKVSGLFVIARHSVFAADKSATIQQIASDLGVRYVLEGTLQRDGPRLRVNAKLIEAVSGLSIWAEKYDRQYADIFTVQDDVIGRIISALSVKLSQGEQSQLARLPTDSLEAYDYYMRAEHEGFIYGDVDTYRRTLSYYQKAIDLDPRFANAYAGIARVAVDVWRNDYNFLWSAAVARKIAYDAAGQALKLDPGNSRAHTVLALLQWVDGHGNEALVSAKNAIDAQPNDAEAYANLALIQAHMGAPEAAVSAIEMALRLDPSPAPGFKLLAGVVFYTAHEDRSAIPLIEAALANLPKTEPAREYLAAAYANLGDQSRAHEEARRLTTLFPESNLSYYRYLYDYWSDEDLEHHLAGLKAAGIPDWPFGFDGHDEDRVKGADLQALVRDQTWIGKHRNGTDFLQYFGPDGKTAYRSANTSITGIVEIRGDRLCEKFDGYFLDRLVCGSVYRNRDMSTGNFAYAHVTPRSLQYFSPAADGR